MYNHLPVKIDVLPGVSHCWDYPDNVHSALPLPLLLMNLRAEVLPAFVPHEYGRRWYRAIHAASLSGHGLGLTPIPAWFTVCYIPNISQGSPQMPASSRYSVGYVCMIAGSKSQNHEKERSKYLCGENYFGDATGLNDPVWPRWRKKDKTGQERAHNIL